MATTCKLLGQAQLTTTDPLSLLTPAKGSQIIVRNIYLCNTFFVPVKFTIFHDDTGSEYQARTTLYNLQEIAGNGTLKLDCHICMNNELGNLAFSCDTPNALTITLYGMEI